TTAVRDRPNAAASVRVDGSRSPSWTCPAAIAPISACATWLDRVPPHPGNASVKLTGVAARVTSAHPAGTWLAAHADHVTGALACHTCAPSDRAHQRRPSHTM